MENRMKALLCTLGISDEDSIVAYYGRVRDRDDVGVFRCKKSGVILLSRTDHMEAAYYEAKSDFTYWGADDRKTAVIAGHEDALRRADQFRNLIANRIWIDIGTGAGGILDLLSPLASGTIAVEPQEGVRKTLQGLGYQVYASITDVPMSKCEVATLFHVMEHIADPIETLISLRMKMAPGGKIIVEVPHARDFLMSFLDLDSFKAFTLWSEHLILHTRESLRRFLEAAGFSEISIMGFQRYPLANHLHWLAKGKPGGHLRWNELRTPALDSAYGDMLAQIDCTDTLIAVAVNNA